ncbi:hypothetical protein [Xylophilus sp. Leaf220]|uniref:hypothetical protein n=1 Tax=Xylophilus sp. Leaf220 TaxID=1735686 RepID=UPI0007000051|nr:hypothetical protein [Xylophilus sp. Leaf220]KQM68600.1 hypothetical protein ASE76_12755 [Xylophilus sp. Leaf220]
MRVAAMLVGLCWALLASGANAAACDAGASDACYFGFEPPAAQGRLHYYASIPPGTAAAAPTRALIALHGHPRDAAKTFDAALRAVRQRGRTGDTLVVAPVFQVDATRAARCSTPGVPAAQPGDLLWTCASWLEGAPSVNGAGLGAFAALDALVAELVRQWPGLRVVTVAGFSAGAQMVQHAIAFAAPAPAGVALRYVVADPGTWLYFDAFRPAPADPATCPEVNRWKYGLEALPAHLPRSAEQARSAYAAAEIHYLEGALDSGEGKGIAYRALDKSCAADAQGPFRLQRGQAYVAHEGTLRAAPRELVVVPGCAHDVACVFPAPEARAALLGAPP